MKSPLLTQFEGDVQWLLALSQQSLGLGILDKEGRSTQCPSRVLQDSLSLKWSKKIIHIRSSGSDSTVFARVKWRLLVFRTARPGTEAVGASEEGNVVARAGLVSSD